MEVEDEFACKELIISFLPPFDTIHTIHNMSTYMLVVIMLQLVEISDAQAEKMQSVPDLVNCKSQTKTLLFPVSFLFPFLSFQTH
jgi:hypothetical protein